jgi:hypothetical protein
MSQCYRADDLLRSRRCAVRNWLCLGLLLWAGVALANDGFAGIAGQGGRLRLLRTEHPTIRMEREWVQLDLYPRYYAVSATFIFSNDGPATSVTMGFPEYGACDGDGGGGVEFPTSGNSAYQHFTTTVDGQPVNVERRVVVPDECRHDSVYQALWVKQVSFMRRQRRTITVRYQAQAGNRGLAGAPNPLTRFAVYQFTGGNWKGTVAESQLTVVSHLTGLIGFTPRVPDVAQLADSVSAEGIWRYTWRNWQAQGDFMLTYAAIAPGYLILKGEGRLFTPTAWTTVLHRPGPPHDPDLLPTVLVRENTAFIELYACNFLLTATPPGYPQASVSTEWNEQTNEASLRAGAHVFRWRPGKPHLIVDSISRPLPSAPFLSAPATDGGRRIYVPLRPLIETLNGTIALDWATRIVTIHVQPWTPMRHTGSSP